MNIFEEMERFAQITRAELVKNAERIEFLENERNEALRLLSMQKQAEETASSYESLMDKTAEKIKSGSFNLQCVIDALEKRDVSQLQKTSGLSSLGEVESEFGFDPAQGDMRPSERMLHQRFGNL